MSKEIWKPMHGHVGSYEVSNFGRIRSLKSSRGTAWRNGPKVLKPLLHPVGHLRVCVKGKGMPVHRAVLEAFVGPRPEGCDGCHLNGDGKDNRLENLAWLTRLESTRRRAGRGALARGSKNGWSKLKEGEVAEIKKLLGSGLSQSTISARYGVCQTTISSINCGINWREA